LRIAVGMLRSLVGLAVRLPAERRQQSLHAAGVLRPGFETPG
jgi:hypothetical protein